MFYRSKRTTMLRANLPSGIDLHCHLLPEADDGARHISDSLEIIRIMKQQGLRGAVCTPHISSNFPHNSRYSLRTAFNTLLQAARVDGLDVTELTAAEAEAPGESFGLYLAAEYMLDRTFLKHLATPGQLLGIPKPLVHQVSAYSAKKYLLAELPHYLLPDNWRDMLDSVRSAGFIPLLAHPERYHHLLTESELIELHENGIRFQGNLGSLTGLYGREAQFLALTLKSRGLYSAWGTDTHSSDMLRSIATRL